MLALGSSLLCSLLPQAALKMKHLLVRAAGIHHTHLQGWGPGRGASLHTKGWGGKR